MPLKRNIPLMYAISFLQGLVFYVSIATLYRRECGLTVFQITLIESICSILCVALEVPWGMLAERIGYKKTLAVCSFLSFAAKFVFWIADGFSMFLLERIILAVVISGLSGVDSSIIYISCGEEKAHRVFGRYSALGSAGLFVSSAIFTLLPEGSYRLSAFLTMIAYGLAAVLALFVAEVRVKPEKPVSPLRSLRVAIENFRSMRGLAPLLLFMVLFFETIHNVTVFFNQLQYARAGANMRVIGAALIIGSVCEMSGVFSEKLAKKLGERRFGLALIALCAVDCAAMAFSANLIMSIAAISFMFAASALLGPLVSVMENRMITTDDRATMLSLNSMITNCLAVPLNLTLGWSADIGLPVSMAMCAVLIAGAGIAFILSANIRRQRIG